jgi:hypothetical protein
MTVRRAWAAAVLVAVVAAAHPQAAHATSKASPRAKAAPALAAPGRTPDFAGYQALLDSFLTVTSKPGEPLETRFHYRNLRQRPDHKEVLANVRHELFDGVAPSAMARNERRAWAINAYNFLVLQAITENFYHPRQSRPSGFPMAVWMPRERVEQIKVNGQDLFKAPLVEVEGKTHTLDTFERLFVFDGFDHKGKGKRPATLDPRAHFALVCGAKGCPPLQPRVYRAETLDAQLDDAVRRTLEVPQHLSISGGVLASSIFNWYAADFGGPAKAFEFLVRHAPAAKRAEIERGGWTSIRSFTLWNWELNQTPLPKYTPPVFDRND